MNYAVLIYGDEQGWASLDDAGRKQVYAAHEEFSRLCAEHGHTITGGTELRDTTTAKTVRGTAESVTVTDGPFAETAEQLGGVYLVETADIDDLARLAGIISFGESVEIRPCMGGEDA